jgi:hypothetical protein
MKAQLCFVVDVDFNAARGCIETVRLHTGGGADAFAVSAVNIV